MQGLTMKSLKHHKAIQPLFLIMGALGCVTAFALVRLAIWSPDVNWSKSKDPLNHYTNQRFKIFNPRGIDYTNLPTEHEIPEYDNKEEQTEK